MKPSLLIWLLSTSLIVSAFQRHSWGFQTNRRGKSVVFGQEEINRSASVKGPTAADSARKLKEMEEQYWADLSAEEREGEQKISLGIAHLKAGDFEKSLGAFDRAQEIKGPTCYIWQRGIALYYTGEYALAAEECERNALIFSQKFDDAPTMELLWAAAARFRMGDAPKALDDFPEFPRESNPVLALALRIYWGEAALAELRPLVEQSKASGFKLGLERGFHGHFFAGLYLEAARKDTHRSAAHMHAAADLARDMATREGGSEPGILESIAMNYPTLVRPEAPARQGAVAGGSGEEDALLDREALSSMTVVALKTLLREKSLPVSGRKAQLVDRLLDEGNSQPPSPGPRDAMWG